MDHGFLDGCCCDACCFSPAGAIGPRSHPQVHSGTREGGPLAEGHLFPRCCPLSSLGLFSPQASVEEQYVNPTLQRCWPSSFTILGNLSFPWKVTILTLFLLWDTWHNFFRGVEHSQKAKKAFDVKFSGVQNPWCKQSVRRLEMRRWKNTVSQLFAQILSCLLFFRWINSS